MISAKEAKEFVDSKSNEELEKLDTAIRIKCSSGENRLHLSTGLTKEAQTKQDKIYSGFNGKLEGNTIKVLKSLGYEIRTDSLYQGSYVEISW